MISSEDTVEINHEKSEIKVSRKRKLDEISKDEEVKVLPITEKPSKRRKIIESDNEESKLDEIMQAEEDLEYGDVSKMKKLTDPSFDPIKDAPYRRHQHIPMSLIAKACQDIEECKGEKSQDAVKLTLANIFRTAI